MTPACLPQRFGAFGDARESVESLGMSALDAVVDKVVVDSRLLPQVSIDRPFATDATGSTDDSPDFMSMLKPRATVYTKTGPIVIAPWGDPGETTYWPLIVAGLALTGALAVYGAVKLARGGK